jgi:hypothetical protein
MITSPDSGELAVSVVVGAASLGWLVAGDLSKLILHCGRLVQVQ